MDWISSPDAWIGLLTLSALEIVLGVDNIIFIAILAGKLPADQRDRARLVGLGAAFVSRVGLLFALGWLVGLTTTLFTAFGHDFSGRDLVLMAGGLFLIAKATREIHHKLEGEAETSAAVAAASFAGVIAQIMVVDIVFSLDSVITAVGMVSSIAIMIIANVVALAFMLAFSGAIATFVERHPTVKMLALAFLIMIGTNLVADALGFHIPKGYTYFAMAFSVGVEMLNLRLRAKAPPVRLRQTPSPSDIPAGTGPA
jgi:predicted tellurium resistance membrane protein TerC